MRSPDALSIRQKEILTYIEGFVQDNGYPPAIRQIQEKLDISSTSVVAYNLKALESKGLKFDGWATPGANARAAALETARVTARRAERRLVSLPAHGRSVRPELVHFTNRLADLLWLLAREAESSAAP